MTAGMNDPAVIFAELIEEITHAANYAPRSLQRRIGPSGIGVECPTWLLHMLAGTPEPEGAVKWKAWVGTAMHAELERIFAASPLQLAADGPRYLLESTVTVGVIGGETITGNCDLFDVHAGAAVDWKSVSKSAADKYRRAILNGKGPGGKYRAQAHIYGLGMLYAGRTVNTVMDVFLPRDGELRDSFYWAEPFDAKVALAAIERANGLAELINNSAVGLCGALEMFKDAPCGDWFCPWCPKTSRPQFEPGEVPDSKRLLGISK